jgi:hypothetical protein
MDSHSIVALKEEVFFSQLPGGVISSQSSPQRVKIEDPHLPINCRQVSEIGISGSGDLLPIGVAREIDSDTGGMADT